MALPVQPQCLYRLERNARCIDCNFVYCRSKCLGKSVIFVQLTGLQTSEGLRISPYYSLVQPHRAPGASQLVLEGPIRECQQCLCFCSSLMASVRPADVPDLVENFDEESK